MMEGYINTQFALNIFLGFNLIRARVLVFKRLISYAMLVTVYVLIILFS